MRVSLIQILNLTHTMVRQCSETDLVTIHEIINDAAIAYRGHIPDDCYHEPYMAMTDLRSEVDAGVVFWGWEDSGNVMGIMGIQKVQDVSLVRHAYVRTGNQGKGVGNSLLNYLLGQVKGTILVGTWAAAYWAIRLYENHGFKMVAPNEKDFLLDKYWTISVRQRDTSVVLLQHR
jgi:N-acetylglutamate synthase-like GNAT family acetyltransferase